MIFDKEVDFTLSNYKEDKLNPEDSPKEKKKP